MCQQSKFQVQKYEDPDREAVLELFGNPPSKRAVFNWQFSRRTTYQPVLVRRGPRAIAFNGVMPVSISIRGTVIQAAWSCDFYVHRDLRKQGLGKLLKTALYRQGKCIMALGVSETGNVILRRLGWENCGSTRCYVRILQAHSFYHRAIHAFQTVVSALNSPIRRRVSRGLTTSISDCLPKNDVLDQLWERCQKSKLAMVCRDADYMKWRYEQMPVKGYSFIQGKYDADPVFLLVCRTTGKTLEIVDYVGEIRKLSEPLAAIDSALSCAKGLRKVECRVSFSQLSTALLLHGFLPNRHKSILFVKLQNGVSRQGIRKWFLTGGDSDSEILRAAKAARH